MSSSEELQKSHYNSISNTYAAHYGDNWSQKYRNKFINQLLVEGIEIDGKLVLEAMCGSGETTGFLLNRQAKVTGLDISENEIENFKEKWSDCDVCCSSIRETGFGNEQFDVVVVVGGLHHVHPYVDQVIEEIHRILKPGGHFCFFEPHKNSFPDLIRKLWYKRDKLFAENEEAIDIKHIERKFARKFSFIKTEYGGNVGYIVIFNSLVLRVPLIIKPLISPFFMFLESIIRPFQNRYTSCFVIGRWKKNN
jgi:SAM-dependent methyltransferase